ncbi:MAG: hypothetical protein ACTTK2_01035 [Hoylesella marshii]|uniref:hypothetical protein n=1 Tax=Hoylesella marshii TaxID=189722 RepID=UPI003FA0FA33
MKKALHILFLSICLFSMTVIPAWALSDTNNTHHTICYIPVEDETTLSAGDKLIIVDLEHDSKHVMGAQNTRNNRKSITVSLDGRVIRDIKTGSVLTLGGTPNFWTLHDGTGYLSSVSNTQNALKVVSQVQPAAKAVIHINEKGHARISFKQYERRYLSYNYRYELFSCYADFSEPVHLFRQSVCDVDIDASGCMGYRCSEPLDFSKTQGIAAYILVTRGTDGIALQEVKRVPANTGVILKGTAGTHYLFASNGTTDDIVRNLLHATSEEIINTDDHVYIPDTRTGVTGLYRLSRGETIPANSIYVILESGTKDFYPFNVFTGIATVENDATPQDIYTVSGMKICPNKMQQGIYIGNHRKVLAP